MSQTTEPGNSSCDLPNDYEDPHLAVQAEYRFHEQFIRQREVRVKGLLSATETARRETQNATLVIGTRQRGNCVVIERLISE